MIYSVEDRKEEQISMQKTVKRVEVHEFLQKQTRNYCLFCEKNKYDRKTHDK